MAAAPNGDLDVALMARGGPGSPGTGGGGFVALRDADKNGRFEVKETISGASTTGIALHNGYLYLAHPTKGQPSGMFEVFAQKFAGKEPLMQPNDAVARPDGVEQAPDGFALHQRLAEGNDLAGDVSR